MMNEQNVTRRRCTGLPQGKACGRFMSNVDLHLVCRKCRGQECSRESPCNVCRNWSEAQWLSYETKAKRQCTENSEEAKMKQQKPDESKVEDSSQRFWRMQENLEKLQSSLIQTLKQQCLSRDNQIRALGRITKIKSADLSPSSCVVNPASREIGRDEPVPVPQNTAPNVSRLCVSQPPVLLSRTRAQTIARVQSSSEDPPDVQPSTSGGHTAAVILVNPNTSRVRLGTNPITSIQLVEPERKVNKSNNRQNAMAIASRLCHPSETVVINTITGRLDKILKTYLKQCSTCALKENCSRSQSCLGERSITTACMVLMNNKNLMAKLKRPQQSKESQPSVEIKEQIQQCVSDVYAKDYHFCSWQNFIQRLREENFVLIFRETYNIFTNLTADRKHPQMINYSLFATVCCPKITKAEGLKVSTGTAGQVATVYVANPLLEFNVSLYEQCMEKVAESKTLRPDKDADGLTPLQRLEKLGFALDFFSSSEDESDAEPSDPHGCQGDVETDGNHGNQESLHGNDDNHSMDDNASDYDDAASNHSNSNHSGDDNPNDADSDQDDHHDDGNHSEDDYHSNDDNDSYSSGGDSPQYESDARTPSPSDHGDDDDNSNGDGDQEDNSSKPEEFADSDHPGRCMSGLYSLYERGEMCDITLVVAGHRFPCHKNVLVASSDYFQTMFTTNLAERSQDTVEMNSFKHDTMKDLLRYLYLGKVLLSEETVQDMLAAADFFNLPALKRGCEVYMERLMDRTNALRSYFFAKLHVCKELMLDAQYIIGEDFLWIADSSEDLVELPAANIAEVLSWDNLSYSESYIYEAAVRWLEHDPDARRDHIYEVFSQIRFSHILKDNHFYFYDKIMTHPLLMCDQRLKALLDEIVQYHTLRRRWAEYDLRTEPRVRSTHRRRWAEYDLRTEPRVRSTHRYVVVTQSTEDNPHRVALYYDDAQSDSAPPGSSKALLTGTGKSGEPVMHPKIIAADNKLFMFGGKYQDANTTSNQVSYWCAKKRKFYQCFDMFIDSLDYFAVAQVDSYIYVIGGRVRYGRSSCVCYKYAVKDGRQYNNVPDLPKLLEGSCAAGFSGRLYVFGGLTQQHKQKNNRVISAECFSYQDREGRWTPLPSLRQARVYAGCAVLNKKIYVIGGGDLCPKTKSGKKLRPLESVEIYDPATGTWADGPPLPVPLLYPGVVKYRATIYVLGGQYENAGSNSVYYLDKATSSWRQGDDLLNSDAEATIDQVTRCSYTVMDVPCVPEDSPDSDHSASHYSDNSDQSDHSMDDQW